MTHGKLVFLAPFPSQDRYLDGWMSRIKTIDEVLSRYPRVYLDFQADYQPPAMPQKVHEGLRVEAYRLSPEVAAHREFAKGILDSARFVYVHTMHQGEHIRPYFDPERMLVDIHGIVPEEELMMGSPERSEFFGEVERDIVMNARYMFVVTQAMADHLSAKYPGSASPFHLPVYDFGASENTKDRLKSLLASRANYEKDACVYAGGAQIWQCAEEMVKLIAATRDIHEHRIYSHNIDEFSSLLAKNNVPSSIFGGYIGKEALRKVYDRTAFGFAIRKDSPVNRVASPTKLCDYCSAGVIPIVDFTYIGDFESYGYKYVKTDDYRSGFIPDRRTQAWMIEHNLGCMDIMRSEFESGIAWLHELIGARFQG